MNNKAKKAMESKANYIDDGETSGTVIFGRIWYEDNVLYAEFGTKITYFMQGLHIGLKRFTNKLKKYYYEKQGKKSVFKQSSS